MTGYVRKTKCKVVRCSHPGCEWLGVFFGVDRKDVDRESRLALVRHALKHLLFGMRALNVTHVEVVP
jgi:hypothetical protein